MLKRPCPENCEGYDALHYRHEPTDYYYRKCCHGQELKARHKGMTRDEKRTHLESMEVERLRIANSYILSPPPGVESNSLVPFYRFVRRACQAQAPGVGREVRLGICTLRSGEVAVWKVSRDGAAASSSAIAAPTAAHGRSSTPEG